MRKVKHSKIRNTGLLYEFLLRQITSEILEKTKKGKYCFEDSATDDNPILEEPRKTKISLVLSVGVNIISVLSFKKLRSVFISLV